MIEYKGGQKMTYTAATPEQMESLADRARSEIGESVEARRRLAKVASVSEDTIRRIYKAEESSPVSTSTVKKVEGALDELGGSPGDLCTGVWDGLVAAKTHLNLARTDLEDTLERAHPLVKPGIERLIEKLDEVAKELTFERENR